MLSYSLGCLDIKGAYIPSGPIKRRVYVRPSIKAKVKRGTLWLLRKLPYGNTEERQQRAKDIEKTFLDSAGYKRIKGSSQLYIIRGIHKIDGIKAKITDDLLLASSVSSLEQFGANSGEGFPIGTAVVDRAISFNGCRSSHEEQGVTLMSMRGKVSHI